MLSTWKRRLQLLKRHTPMSFQPLVLLRTPQKALHLELYRITFVIINKCTLSIKHPPFLTLLDDGGVFSGQTIF